MRILVLSNGRGEDSIALTLLSALVDTYKSKGSSVPEITAFPLIGDGDVYKAKGFNVTASGFDLPSLGFGGTSLASFFRDLAAGLISQFFRQISLLRRAAKEADLILCFGDIYPVLLAFFFAKKPMIHIATAISSTYREHNAFELMMFRKKCRMVFTRDQATADFLSSKGVKAVFLGNLMMDDPNVLPQAGHLSVDKNKKIVALIPSSRGDAEENLLYYIRLIRLFRHPGKFLFLASVSANFEVGKFSAPGSGIDLKIIRGNFASIVGLSSFVIGSTGTGSEQAAGMGRPLVIIKGKGPHTSASRMTMYSRILSGAVFIPTGSDQDMAAQIESFADDGPRISSMGEAGKAIMGGPGGAKKIALEIFNICQSA